MKFNMERYTTAKFEDRVSAVPVPELKDCFDDLKEGEVPVWKVRGLNGMEVAIANQEISDRQIEVVKAIITKIMSKLPSDMAAAVDKAIEDTPDGVPSDLVKKYNYLVQGSVEPPCTDDFARKLAHENYEVFCRLTNKIHELTVMGRVGEFQGSGESQ